MDGTSRSDRVGATDLIRCRTVYIPMCWLLTRSLGVQVKAWAQRHRVNDPAAGSLNSYALTLMVLFHLQSVTPPIMPTMAEILFEERPIEGGFLPSFLEDASMGTFGAEVKAHCRELSRSGYGLNNTQTTAELFLSFIVRFMALAQAWASGSATTVRMSTFTGALHDARFEKDHVMLLEDPFDSTDNCARTLGTWQSPSGGLDEVLEALFKSQGPVMSLRSTECVKELMCELFGKRAVAAVDFSGMDSADEGKLRRSDAAAAGANANGYSMGAELEVGGSSSEHEGGSVSRARRATAVRVRDCVGGTQVSEAEWAAFAQATAATNGGGGNGTRRASPGGRDSNGFRTATFGERARVAAQRAASVGGCARRAATLSNSLSRADAPSGLRAAAPPLDKLMPDPHDQQEARRRDRRRARAHKDGRDGHEGSLAAAEKAAEASEQGSGGPPRKKKRRKKRQRAHGPGKPSWHDLHDTVLADSRGGASGPRRTGAPCCAAAPAAQGLGCRLGAARSMASRRCCHVVALPHGGVMLVHACSLLDPSGSLGKTASRDGCGRIRGRIRSGGCQSGRLR
jgi:hypothetical protein